jgi:hypothetical protein
MDGCRYEQQYDSERFWYRYIHKSSSIAVCFTAYNIICSRVYDIQYLLDNLTFEILNSVTSTYFIRSCLTLIIF